jgi:hypothetical protein
MRYVSYINSWFGRVGESAYGSCCGYANMNIYRSLMVYLSKRICANKWFSMLFPLESFRDMNMHI